MNSPPTFFGPPRRGLESQRGAPCPGRANERGERDRPERRRADAAAGATVFGSAVV